MAHDDWNGIGSDPWPYDPVGLRVDTLAEIDAVQYCFMMSRARL